jgi:radical SAM protein with 4Fe4S-binding SPASM domain
VPLTDETADELEEIVEFALDHDIRNFSFFAIACLDGEEAADAAGALPARALPQVATMVTEAAEDADLRFIWEAPVRFDVRKTLAEHIITGPRAGGDVSIRVEPDGTVCPPRGKKLRCGNVLEQPWSEIWQHEAFTRYRESVEAPLRCDVCPDLELCAAACPKDPAGWADDTENGGAS